MKSGVRQLTACTLFLYGLVFLAIVFVAIVGLWLFGPTRLRDKDLTEIPFASWFPESAMYIEGYCVVMSSIESRISFYKVTIDRSEVEEFMQHAPGAWVEGNAITEGFPSRLKRRWREMSRARRCYSYTDALHTVSVCLDGSEVSTIYVRERDSLWGW